MSEELLVSTNNDGDDQGEQMHVSKKGLNIWITSVFIIGAMCGSGVLAIPKAIVDSGYIGIPLLIICGIISSYTGTLLGNCWSVLRVRYPEYCNQRVTDPYPMIAYRAAGKVGEYATRFCIDATLFGGATVFLLLICENTSQLVKDFSNGDHDFSLCYLLLIMFGILCPLTWFGTPKDFWQAGFLAALTSTLAGFLIFVGLAKDHSHHHDVKHSNPSFASFFTAFGTILFSFGGASCFPTVQVDMADPTKFPRSVVMGLTTVLSVYMLVGITGFFIIGDDMTANVIESLPSDWVSYTVNILITFHLLMAFVIIANPVNQEMEGFLKIPDNFSIRRIVVRTLYAAAITFMALTIPHFSVILALVGGSTIAATNFIFPPLFYLLLSGQRTPSAAFGSLPSYASPITSDSDIENEQNSSTNASTESITIQSSARKDNKMNGNWKQIEIQNFVKVILWEIIIVGAVGGTSSTYFAIQSLANGDSGFTVPCYVDPGVGL